MLKKIIKISAAIISTIAVIVVFVLSPFIVSFRQGDYYVVDEQLFLKAHESINTIYYAYDKFGNAVEVFNTVGMVGSEWANLSDIGENLKNAFISAEDRDFYKHRGVNIKRTFAAMLNHFIHLKPSFGASTITQQVIKNISGNNEQSIKRKFNEIIRSLHLEKNYSKNDILEVYLNIVPMTGNIYGVSAASKLYFNKNANELTLAEAATIAGITNSPARYNPYTHPDFCIEKRNRVLYSMLNNNVITKSEYEAAISSELCVSKIEQNDKIYSGFIETANSDIINDIVAQKGISKSAASLLLRGTKIYLTEDTSVQEILEDYFAEKSNFSANIDDGLEYSMVVTDNENGNVVGVVGGIGIKSANNLLNLSEVKIPPASTLKPLALYAPMIEAGMINWSTVIDDTPLNIKNVNGEKMGYPVNSPNVYSGLTTVCDAIRLSKNTVPAKLLEAFGFERCSNELLKRYKFNIINDVRNINGRVVTDNGIAPLALGQLTEGVSLRQLTDAYTCFARDGVIKRGNTYYGVFDFGDNLVVSPNMTEKRIYKTDTVNVMNQLLVCVVDDGTAKAVKLKEKIDTAGKTGTSSQSYDKVFIGYTPYYTAGIWCGYPMRNKSVEGVYPSHVTVWDEVMRKIHDNTVLSSYSEPLNFSTDGLIRVRYCKDSGMLAGELCECDLRGNRCEWGYFIRDNMPNEKCNIHKELKGGDFYEKLSAPDIQRKNDEDIYIVDDEYSYEKIKETNGLFLIQ